MIFLIHGNDLSKTNEHISKVYQKFKTNNPDTIKEELDGSTCSIDLLLATINKLSIFSAPVLTVLDVSKASTAKQKELYTALAANSNAQVVVFSASELTKTNPFLKNSSDLDIKVLTNTVKPQSNIFNFLDALFYKNRTKAYAEYKKLIDEDENELKIFSMIQYGLRNIATVIFESPAKKDLHPFVYKKTNEQAKKYSEDSVRKLYEELYHLDKQVKTGQIKPDMLIPVVMEKVLS